MTIGSRRLLSVGSIPPPPAAPTPTPAPGPSGPTLDVAHGEEVLGGARILIDWSDAANHNGKFAVNQNDPRVPTSNLIAFPTGPTTNESASSTPPRTTFYSSLVGPDGLNNATRVLTSGTNQIWYLYRSSTASAAIPAGTLSIRGRMRANAGTGPFDINFGLTTAYATDSAQDLDWTDSTNDASTTFSGEITWNGAGDIAIRFPSSGADVLIDHLQLYEGALADMPDWEDEVWTGGRKAFAATSSLPLDADDNVDTTGTGAGMLIYDPSFPTPYAYTDYTVMTVNSVDSVPTTSKHIVNLHPNSGGTSTGNVIICEGTSPYAGEIAALAGPNSRTYHSLNVAGDGIFIAGHGRSSTGTDQRKVWFDAASALIEDRTFAGINVSTWTQGSFTTTDIADQRGFQAEGTYCYFVVWDRLLTDAEWADASEAIRARLTLRGVAMADIREYHNISGDSNATKAAGTWPQLVTADGFFGTEPNMLATITSVGGQGIDQWERDTGSGSGNESELPDSTITVNGRFEKRDNPSLRFMAMRGARCLHHFALGTNDRDEPGLEDAGSTNAYTLRIQEAIQHVLDVHPLIDVMYETIRPQAAGGYPNMEAQRLAHNTAMRTWIDGQDRVFLCDTGGSATLGTYPPSATYYLGDQIHYSTVGEIEAAAQRKTAVEDWRDLRFGTPETLDALTLSPLTIGDDVLYTGTITGATVGSTIVATASDGTSLTVTGTTVTGTFANPGSVTINLIETLAGATNSPRTSPQSFTVTPPPAATDLTLRFVTDGAGQEVSIPLVVSGTGTVIDWDDGSTTNANTSGWYPHTFASAGTYDVTIPGNKVTKIWGTGVPTTQLAKLTAVVAWGDHPLTHIWFYHASALTSVPSTLPTTVTSLNETFKLCSTFNSANVSNWDVSRVLDCTETFKDATLFNQPLNWSAPACKNFQRFIGSATNFNQRIDFIGPLVTDIADFANAAPAWNGAGVEDWDTSGVKGMANFALSATAFNGDVSGWDVSKCTNFTNVFNNADSFNRDIGGWDVSAGTLFSGMFRNTALFNQDIGDWDTHNVGPTGMNAMFQNALSFNQDLSGWCVTNIPTQTSTFAQNSPLASFPAKHPVWGTCPGPAGPTLPGDISDLVAAAQSETEILLTWTAASNAVSHEYRIDGGVAVATSTNTSHTVEDLLEGSEYNFEVRGVNADGNGNWSNVATESTDAAAPPPSTGGTYLVGQAPIFVTENGRTYVGGNVVQET